MKELKPKAKELCATQLALRTHKTLIHSDIEMSIVRYESVSANRSYDLQKKPLMFFKIGILKDFAIFTGKQLCWGLFSLKSQAFCGASNGFKKALKAFIKRFEATQKACNFIKKRTQHRSFLVNIAKFSRTAFLQNNSGGCFWTVDIGLFQSSNHVKHFLPRKST